MSRILRVKFQAGLFDHPYVDVSQAGAAQLRPDAVALARKDAARSMVLLKNDNSTLPLDPAKKTAVIGPLGDDGHDMLGPWWGTGRDEDAVTLFNGIKAQSPGRRRSCRPAPCRTPSRRSTTPRMTARPARVRPGGRRGQRRPTRSCSRSARRGR